MKFKRNNNIAIIPINEDEIMIKEGVFSQRTILIEDKKRSHLLNRISSFIKEHSTFTKDDLQNYFIESGDNLDELIDFLIDNKLANKIIQKKKKQVAIITNFDKSLVSEILSKSYTTIDYTFFDESLFYLDDNLDEKFTFDFVLMVYDRYSPKDFHHFNYWANKHNLKNQISFLDNRVGYVFPINEPQYTVCYNEVEIHLEATVKNLQEVLIHKEEIISNENCISPKYSDLIVYCAILVNLIDSFDTVGFEKNVLTIINFETFSIEKTKVFHMPYCSACNLNEEYTHIFL
ncbi:hypothetical protein [Enterococcus faecium]|uniref:Bacteriocin biosynthesis cyclodehydratase n=1 Tax=Enterococcus faecium TaxID=1352 RepID=A0A242ASR7_ENTFC|nr:hypothetical protein [Enterococcus faecium]OTN83648.1 hypothetical protein A5810_003129 [Enterococcus faecium]